MQLLMITNWRSPRIFRAHYDFGTAATLHKTFESEEKNETLIFWKINSFPSNLVYLKTDDLGNYIVYLCSWANPENQYTIP